MKAFLLVASLILISGFAGASEHAFGTKVAPEDSDVGKHLLHLSEGTRIGFWDIGPQLDHYDYGDVVYIDLPPIGRVNLNDVRLTPFGDLQEGAKVKPIDEDIDASLKPLPANIRFLDLNGNQLYDLEDSVYVHQSPIGFKEQPSYAGDCKNRPAGTHCAIYTDSYTLLIFDSFAAGVWNLAGSWQGKRMEVIHGSIADYYHIVGTPLMKQVPKARKCQDCSGSNGTTEVEEFENGNYISNIPDLIFPNDIRLTFVKNLTQGQKLLSSTWITRFQ